MRLPVLVVAVSATLLMSLSEPVLSGPAPVLVPPVAPPVPLKPDEWRTLSEFEEGVPPHVMRIASRLHRDSLSRGRDVVGGFTLTSTAIGSEAEQIRLSYLELDCARRVYVLALGSPVGPRLSWSEQRRPGSAFVGHQAERALCG